jgi:lysozyme family protein
MTPEDDDLIDGLLVREGGFSDHPNDRGGPTKWGITAIDLGAWRKLGRAASHAEVRDLTAKDAKAIFVAWYLKPFAWVGDPALRAQLVDFGVLHGQTTAIRQLQQVLGVAVDGVAGPRTQAAVAATDPRLLGNALVGARCHYIAAILERDPTQLVFAIGWYRRAVGFVA